MKSVTLVHLFACTALLLGLAGCAAMDASNQRSLLSAAGFRVRTPETAKQKELYAAAESYKVLRANANGKDLYVYKDEKNGVAYVGGEAEYQKYQELAVKQKIASDNYMVAQMNQQMAFGWYGAWGPGFGGPWVGPRYFGPRIIR